MPRACAIPWGFKSEPGGGRADAGQRMAGNAWLGTLALAETASMPRGALSGRPRQTSGQQQEFDSVDSIESDSSNQILGSAILETSRILRPHRSGSKKSKKLLCKKFRESCSCSCQELDRLSFQRKRFSPCSFSARQQAAAQLSLSGKIEPRSIAQGLPVLADSLIFKQPSVARAPSFAVTAGASPRRIASTKSCI